MPSILSRLARLWSPRLPLQMRQPAGRSSRSRFVPRLERLEDRTVPAGTVNAVFNAVTGALTLTAVVDPAATLVNAFDQSIILDGAGANTITVTGVATTGGATTITGVGAPTFAGVKSVRLVMGLGNDTVVLTDAVLTGNVTVLGGSGNNTLNIDNTGGGNVTIGSLTVTNGDGSDTLNFGLGNHTVNGNTIVKNGLGNSITAIGAGGVGVNQFKGVSVTNLDGFDNFLINGADTTFTGAVTIRNGNGGSLTSMIGTGNNTFKGGLTVISGAGDDDFTTGGTLFTVGDPLARRNLTISNGTGEGNTDQVFNATTHQINGNVSVTAAAGDDILIVNGTNFNVLGSVRVSVGTGGSTTSFSPGAKLDIDGAVTVIATEGQDNLEFDGLTSVDLLSVTFSSGNGDSDLVFNGATTTATGTIRHASAVGDSTTEFNAAITNVKAVISTHTDGFDFFDTNGGTSFTSAAITIRNGNGGSNTSINNTGTNTVTGAISIVNGDGLDQFRTGGTAFTLGAGATGLLRRNLAINHGTGGSLTSFQATTDTINGAISVVNGNGLDAFLVASTKFAVTGATGNVTINHGIGGSNSSIAPAGVVTDNVIGGRLTITGTDGDDLVSLGRLTVAGATTLTTGNGGDTIQVDDSRLGIFRVTAGAGRDTVNIEQIDTSVAGGSTFGASNINLGNGDDRLFIGLDGDDFAVFASAVLNGGLDLDRYLTGSVNNAGLPVVGPALPSFGFEQLS